MPWSFTQRASCSLHALLETLADAVASLRDEDLRHMLGMNTKEVHKLCGKLREDRFLTS